MDKQAFIAFLAGTIARGLMWVVAAIAARTGAEAIGEDTVQTIAAFVATAVFALGALLWSKWKDGKLLKQEPPA